MSNKSVIKLKTFRCGEPRKRGEDLRIGTVRYKPRGVKKKDYAKYDYFDIWFPSVAPSRELMTYIKNKYQQDKEIDKSTWERFSKRYINELNKSGESRQSVHLLAEMAKRMPISIGCYCGDENYCHRSILKKIISKVARGCSIK